MLFDSFAANPFSEDHREQGPILALALQAFDLPNHSGAYIVGHMSRLRISLLTCDCSSLQYLMGQLVALKNLQIEDFDFDQIAKLL
jgi:hypothetical protein